MIFERDIAAQLIDWKEAPGRKPLLLRGARQVGKTHILKHLGRTAFEETAYFNFEEQPALKQFFEQTKDVKKILHDLSLVHGRAIQPLRTLILLD